MLEIKDEPILYILVRKDLPSMNPGKAMAQASHASSLFVSKYYDNLIEQKDIVKEWLKQGSGFGTTVVMECTKEDLNDFLKEMEEVNLPTVLDMSTVVDYTYPFKGQTELLNIMSDLDKTIHCIKEYDTNHEGYTFCTRSEETCAYIFFYGDESQKNIFKVLMEKHNIFLHH